MGLLESAPPYRYRERISVKGVAVTLPQRSFASKAILLILLLLSSPALAQEDEGRLTLFSCGTDPVDDEGWLDLNGIAEDYDTWGHLRFERSADGTGEIVYSYPPEGTDSKTAFLFSHSDGPEGYLVSIRWEDQGRNYVYYSLDIPPAMDAEDDMGGGEAGLVISEHGTLVERVACIERPYMFISYMRNAMSCDVGNPYGPAACADDSYDRTVPLDVSTIGIVAE